MLPLRELIGNPRGCVSHEKRIGRVCRTESAGGGGVRSAKGSVFLVSLLLVTGCNPTNAVESHRDKNAFGPGGAHPVGQSTLPEEQIDTLERVSNWRTSFTSAGMARSGPYTRDPHVWVYTRDFAERFGMPEEWISEELTGVEAAAWRMTKTGYVTCGWGGKTSACKEEAVPILELYFDVREVKLPWARWSRQSDILALIQWSNSQGFLVPQDCELRRENSRSPIGYRASPCEGRISRQPLADPATGDEVFLFVKSVNNPSQGNFFPLYAYDRRSFKNLAWLQIAYKRPVGLFNDPEGALITFETRTAPLGKTLKEFHQVILPASFDRRIKQVLDVRRKSEREFYKNSLDMK